MSQKATHARAGIALASVVVALALIGALAGGAFLAAMNEARAGRDALAAPPALAAAERGLVQSQRSWDRARTVGMRDGETTGPDSFVFADGSTAAVRVTRLDPFTFWGTADGESRVGGARRSVNLVLRLAFPTMPIAGALTTRGAVVVSDSSVVSGIDSPPAQVTACGAVRNPVAAVVAADTAVVCAGACASSSPPHLVGTPPKHQDTIAGDSGTYSVWGEESWETLVSHADVVLSGGAVQARPSIAGGRCDRRDPLNWGDPRRAGPCADYYPIIYSAGDLRVGRGAIGQGVLLVDGDLELDGVEFHGVVIVRDDLASVGGPNQILGAAMVANDRPIDPTRFAHGTMLHYSSCAVDRALRGSARLVRAKQRGWAELR